ncbi:uncharacterized protein C1orf198 homolog isoform X1 [Lytechinus variegatus]|uniref:uncharacterized protein C1orf198 homolog isoform X1 n=1 Tax=Lytechinus variegatus TaxID=7654 RepID=UPI001BB2C15A|nr:uncharacterized protein C1orf198 homolog isoform X1 [Lytechinus variegatus]
MTNQTMEEICDDYFASMNPIAYKIIEEKRKCMEKNRRNWERLTQAEKDSLLDEWFIDPDLKIRYEIRLQGQLLSNKDAPPESFPRLNIQGGTKTVQYTEHEDGSQSKGNTITWKDEFSGPFLWETKCQQDLPMMSPGSITAQSTRNGEYPENRFSLGLDANDESQLIVNSTKSKGKDGKRAPDPAEKPDKTKLSRKDSKKEERAKEKERAREKENQKRESPVSIVQQQPKIGQSPLADMNQIMMDKNGKGPKKDKTEKAKSPKAPRGRGSGKASPRREGKKEKNFDLEGLLPASDPKEERSLEGINFSMSGLETTESDGLLSSTATTRGLSSGPSGSVQHTPVPSSPPPSSPPASAASAGSDQATASEGGGGAEGEEGASFDFLLSW